MIEVKLQRPKERFHRQLTNKSADNRNLRVPRQLLGFAFGLFLRNCVADPQRKDDGRRRDEKNLNGPESNRRNRVKAVETHICAAGSIRIALKSP